MKPDARSAEPENLNENEAVTVECIGLPRTGLSNRS
jgi:hypothetical protein